MSKINGRMLSPVGKMSMPAAARDAVLEGEQLLNPVTAAKIAASLTPEMLALVLTGCTLTRRSLYRWRRLRHGNSARRQACGQNRRGKSCLEALGWNLVGRVPSEAARQAERCRAERRRRRTAGCR
jgi:hypothetical protein